MSHRYLRRLQWSREPLTLAEMLWKKRAEAGDMDALLCFLASRCKDDTRFLTTFTEEEVELAIKDIAAALEPAAQVAELIAQNGLH